MKLLIMAIGLSLMFQAQAKQYYINNILGSNCRDADNLSPTPQLPWCSLTKINEVQLQAGDVVNLARGATWINQTMHFDQTDNGLAGNPVTIKSYGDMTKARPHIKSDYPVGNQRTLFTAIELKNAKYWRISDLELSNAGVGLLFIYEPIGTVQPTGYEDIQVSNIFTHDIYGYVKGIPSDSVNNPYNIQFSAGILFTAHNLTPAAFPTFPLVTNIGLDNISGTHNQDTVALAFPVGVSGNERRSATNIRLDGLHVWNDDAAGQSTSCSDSVRLVRISDFTMLNSLIEKAAACYSESGTAAVFVGHSENVKIINNIIRDTPITKSSVAPFAESADQSAIDFEINNLNAKVLGNLFSGNRLGTECMVMYGLSARCSFDIQQNSYINNRRGGIFIYGQDVKPTGTLQNNFYNGIPGFYFKTNQYLVTTIDNKKENRTDPTNAILSEVITQVNSVETNINLGNVDYFYSAAADFKDSSSTQPWSYKYYNAATSKWLPLSEYSINSERADMWTVSPTIHDLFITRFEMRAQGAYAVAREWKAPRSGTIRGIGEIIKIKGTSVRARIVLVRNLIETQIWPTSAGYQLITPVGNAFSDLGVQMPIDELVVQQNDIVRFEVSAPEGNLSTSDNTTSWAPMIAYVDSAVGKPIVWNFNTENWLEYWANAASNDIVDIIGNPSIVIDPITKNGSLHLVTKGKTDATTPNPLIRSRLAPTNDTTVEPGISPDYRYVTVRMKHNGTKPGKIKIMWIYDPIDTTITDADSTWTLDRVVELDLRLDGEYANYVFDLKSSPKWVANKNIRQFRIDPVDGISAVADSTVVDIDYIKVDKTP